MSAPVKETGAVVVPCLRYRDAPAAIDWLCRAFGFEKRHVIANDDGTVAHAELRFGNSMIMLGSAADTPHGRLMTLPEQAGGCTQGLYVVVPAPDALLERASAAGATVVLPIQDHDYGGRDFTCRDPEGHLWTFGTYDPWKAPAF